MAKGFFVALLVALGITPVVRRLALRTGTVEHPNERRIKKGIIPTAGGVAIVLSFWAGALASGLLGQETLALLLGTIIILITGIIDDRRELRPLSKLIGQVGAAVIVALGGVRIEFVTNPFGGMWYLGWLSIPATVLWIVAITNMINFIDGLDGLAAGVSAIACAPLLLVALQMGHLDAAAMTIALAGAALGFLRYNFNPAQIIMGDTGALFLGFTLAVVSVLGAMKGAATVAMAIPALALGLPIFDTTCVVIRRVRNGKPFYEADSSHLHHCLLAEGFSQRQVVGVLYGVACGLGAAAVVVAFSSKVMALTILLGVVFTAVSVARRLPGVSSQSSPGSGHNGLSL
ncbi:MAG: undecaprenyl/decaprenyl-phosphate alpha-N-acetylglucosaminyl 1-phosphate transferase [Firmicutes bacterium]|nr:undecaprenyl/decaprenyl-phosphate alpha-N-acetylglucosaminyl 1-phosphate transferase [Bacillota bacterium]